MHQGRRPKTTIYQVLFSPPLSPSLTYGKEAVLERALLARLVLEGGGHNAVRDFQLHGVPVYPCT